MCPEFFSYMKYEYVIGNFTELAKIPDLFQIKIRRSDWQSDQQNLPNIPA
jgi:hypothetical protein